MSKLISQDERGKTKIGNHTCISSSQDIYLHIVIILGKRNYKMQTGNVACFNKKKRFHFFLTKLFNSL